ncbi:MAG: HD domain-containing protein [Deltaproteobacteria bacterium]|nr:HD domain-containing protein [Deltaproteobacteria bacterium]
MKIELTFLRSNVARRIFTLFIFCALVPILAMAIISFIQVRNQLYEQGQRRLHQSSKAMGVSIFERLTFLENELKIVSSSLNSSPSPSKHRPTEEYSKRLKERFKGLSLLTNAGKSVSFFGPADQPTEQSEEEREHLRSGKTLIVSHSSENNRLHIYMMRMVDLHKMKEKILCGEINCTYLWGSSASLSTMTEFCILDDSNHVMYSSIPLPSSFHETSALQARHSPLRQFTWKYEDKEYLASFWDIFTEYTFFYPKWRVVLSVSKDHIFAPITYFKKIFPLVILLSFWVVLLLSIIQIRRTMLPLEKLKDGTQRIAMRDFESRITVTSGDEFEELGESFNTMAKQLGRQFNALTTMSEIDRAILSALDTDKIVGTVITRMHEFFSYDFVSIMLLDSKGENRARRYVGSGKPDVMKIDDDLDVSHEAVEKFIDNRETILINTKRNLPPVLAPLDSNEINSFAIIPLSIKQRLAGIITLGFLDSSAIDQEDLHHARQLADQVAVALSNAQLIEELESLNWGTLTALARTVDAKSPWTAGHSERVTEIALKIGQVMGLTPSELENLNRGGLLHDIGKIAVPVSILDKPGKLTEEEYQIIQEHSSIGARILEPIDAYVSVIPMVLQHHEHFNGKGYPDGVAGEDISLGARILAVADVFDAITSERPYRKKMDLEVALKIIKQESGEQFDPKVVQAFLEVI